MRSRRGSWSHRTGARMKTDTEPPLSLGAMPRRTQREAGGGLLPEPEPLAPSPQTPTPKRLLLKPPYRWHFVTAACDARDTAPQTHFSFSWKVSAENTAAETSVAPQGGLGTCRTLLTAPPETLCDEQPSSPHRPPSRAAPWGRSWVRKGAPPRPSRAGGRALPGAPPGPSPSPPSLLPGARSGTAVSDAPFVTVNDGPGALLDARKGHRKPTERLQD